METPPPSEPHSTVDPFNRDVGSHAGYQYTTGARLSSNLANRRLSDITLDAADFSGKRVIDIGCGDGTYTIELFDRSGAQAIVGIDPAERAIEAAAERVQGRAIEFHTGSALTLPHADDSFDVAHLRGVLHHMTRPQDAIREALRVAPCVVIIEPNGYNPVLKLIERCSAYHREHEEKSYPAFRLRRWAREAGGRVVWARFAGLVPFFCPDAAARALKVIEPMVEFLPGVRALGCAVYVMTARRT